MTRQNDIVIYYASLVKYCAESMLPNQYPVLSLLGITAFSSLYHGMILLPQRYAEFLLALLFKEQAQFVVVSVLSKTLAACFIQKMLSLLLKRDEVNQLALSK